MNPSAVPTVSCSRCNTPLPPVFWNRGAFRTCPECLAETKVYVFPALFRGISPGKAPETALVESDAGCFYHPQKKAEAACGYCGRFLCALCDVDWGGKHLCPPCIEAGKKVRKIGNLENRRILYDEIALSLAILPLLFFYFTILTAPMALFLSIRHWNTPCSIVRGSRIRFFAAILISSLQIVGWAVLAYFVIRRIQ